jgi:hypothetical protein
VEVMKSLVSEMMIACLTEHLIFNRLVGIVCLLDDIGENY